MLLFLGESAIKSCSCSCSCSCSSSFRFSFCFSFCCSSSFSFSFSFSYSFSSCYLLVPPPPRRIPFMHFLARRSSIVFGSFCLSSYLGQNLNFYPHFKAGQRTKGLAFSCMPHHAFSSMPQHAAACRRQAQGRWAWPKGDVVGPCATTTTGDGHARPRGATTGKAPEHLS